MRNLDVTKVTPLYFTLSVRRCTGQRSQGRQRQRLPCAEAWHAEVRHSPRIAGKPGKLGVFAQP